jgi:hypothetical protein
MTIFCTLKGHFKVTVSLNMHTMNFKISGMIDEFILYYTKVLNLKIIAFAKQFWTLEEQPRWTLQY